MATEKKQYVYRLMKMKCSCGMDTGFIKKSEFTQYLNLPEDHGVFFNDKEHPLMNANDHVSTGIEKTSHINTFGKCSSPTNPGNLVVAGMLTGLFMNPIIGMAAHFALKSLFGTPCFPQTYLPWINVDEDYFIDGAPALTIESTLTCYYGGIITIVAELEGEASQSEQQEDKPEDKKPRELLPSEVQEMINDFTDLDEIEEAKKLEAQRQEEERRQAEQEQQEEAARKQQELMDQLMSFGSEPMNPVGGVLGNEYTDPFEGLFEGIDINPPQNTNPPYTDLLNLNGLPSQGGDQ